MKIGWAQHPTILTTIIMTNPDAMEYVQLDSGMNASPIVVQVGSFNQFPTNIYSSYLIHEFQISDYIVILLVIFISILRYLVISVQFY